MAFSKITFNGETLMDVTQNTVTASNLLNGIIATGADGQEISGSIPTKAATTYTPTTTAQVIAAGSYLTGNQTILGDANLIPSNIAAGVSIFGVVGTHTGGITPTGTIAISSNGTYDVTNYASASVKVGATVSGAKLIVPEGMIGV